jgi:hypothetical protein
MLPGAQWEEPARHAVKQNVTKIRVGEIRGKQLAATLQLRSS